MENSKYQGTVGKIILCIRVVDIEYEQIVFWHASGRNFAKLISLLIFGVGFIMCGFTEKKTSLT